MQRRAVITGIGVVSAGGIGKEAFWKSVATGVSGIKKITFFETAHLRSHIAGEITEFDPLNYLEKKEIRDIDRCGQLAIAAVSEAVQDSGFLPDEDTGIVVGTGLGGITTDNLQHENYYTKGYRFVSPMTIPMSMYNAPECYISQRYGLKGEGITVTTACSSGANAVGEAHRLIIQGLADSVICGGVDATLSQAIFTAWASMRILSKRNETPASACRPYSIERDGMVLGEGAAFFIVEESSKAAARSADIYAEITGYATSHDADHITAPNLGGQVKAIKKALSAAALSPEKIDYVSGHGTGTALNDKVETEAIKSVFGETAYKIPISSIKPIIGHTLGASGAFGIAASCLAMRDNIIPPTINYMTPDPECDLDYVPNTARKKEVNTAMCNSFAFGGNNAVLIIKRYASD
jgi:3-oxoacyl-[acyl-carrier-protein] synthase II